MAMDETIPDGFTQVDPGTFRRLVEPYLIHVLRIDGHWSWIVWRDGIAVSGHRTILKDATWAAGEALDEVEGLKAVPPARGGARLIAAAPDLLAACLAMLGTWGGQDEEIINLSRDMARAAVDKALGTEEKS